MLTHIKSLQTLLTHIVLTPNAQLQQQNTKNAAILEVVAVGLKEIQAQLDLLPVYTSKRKREYSVARKSSVSRTCLKRIGPATDKYACSEGVQCVGGNIDTNTCVIMTRQTFGRNRIKQECTTKHSPRCAACHYDKGLPLVATEQEEVRQLSQLQQEEHQHQNFRLPEVEHEEDRELHQYKQGLWQFIAGRGEAWDPRIVAVD